MQSDAGFLYITILNTSYQSGSVDCFNSSKGQKCRDIIQHIRVKKIKNRQHVAEEKAWNVTNEPSIYILKECLVYL